MKYKHLLVFSFSFLSLHSFSQSNKAYAITGQSAANFNWVDIRQIDLSTGTSIKTIFESGKTNFMVQDLSTKQTSNSFDGEDGNSKNNGDKSSKKVVLSPTQGLVAAAAFDQKHNRIFFMPLKGGELSYAELNGNDEKIKFYTTPSAFANINFNDEANSITRMTIGADGMGYAISNDGNHLLQFSTGNKIEIKDLGALVDADKNKGMSVHNKCSGWGGDVVGDAYGKLYLFTSARNIYIIDPKTRVATYRGAILNLPATFATNGAAVDLNDNVIVSSANNFEGFYKVNLNDLKATKLVTIGQVFNASDLANSNLLFQNKFASESVASPVINDAVGNDVISIYPNPAIGTECKISFDKMTPGTYNLVMTDLQGREIMNRQVFLKTGSQVENLGLKKKPSSGMYLIKLTDANNRSMFSDKIVIN